MAIAAVLDFENRVILPNLHQIWYWG